MDSNDEQELATCRNANGGSAAHGFDHVKGVLDDNALNSWAACNAEAIEKS
jgi:hypothetical protein